MGGFECSRGLSKIVWVNVEVVVGEMGEHTMGMKTYWFMYCICIVIRDVSKVVNNRLNAFSITSVGTVRAM